MARLEPNSPLWRREMELREKMAPNTERKKAERGKTKNGMRKEKKGERN